MNEGLGELRVSQTLFYKKVAGLEEFSLPQAFNLEGGMR